MFRTLRFGLVPKSWLATALLFTAVLAMFPATAGEAVVAPSLEDSYGMLAWRNVGPARGGRSIAAAGSRQRPNEYYFGATGGGLWKTTDGGGSWRPVTDGQIGSASVGAVAIDPTNPDVVYIGMGEGQLRGNVLQGDGVYKSVDGGRTWRHLGLAATRTITRIRVHPEDPDIIYVAALGDPFAENADRGIYRSRDGGETWEQILFKSPRTGAIDLSQDPSDPQVLFATLWQVYRKPWKLWSGGPESSLWKSTDGGDSWIELTRNPGLPAGVLGKMTVAVSPANPRRVFANIEAEEGGLYRSDDGGASWRLINGNRKLWQRSFYFLRLQPDPVDEDTVYVLSFRFEKSTDGGESFTAIPTRHGDAHDLWIDPSDPRRMILADDGGASVTINGGESWSEQDMPTAQIYRLATSNEFPYRLCGTQQDNTSICVPSRNLKRHASMAHVDSFDDFETIARSENGFVAPDPRNPDVFFVTSTNQVLRVDTGAQAQVNVSPYPYGVMGQAAASMRERWNWITPVVFSPADETTLYAGSQHLWRSRDQGDTWERISGDLTRAEPDTLGETGGPIRLDQDGPEVYATLYAIAPSPLEPQLIWAGSDDGLVHLTRSGGGDWKNVSPPQLPAHSRIGEIHASSHAIGTAYVVARRYEMGDRRPYVYRTGDFGATWSEATAGLASDDFAYSITEDHRVPGLLFLGTEHGVAVSFDAGARWHSLSLNLPVTPVTGIEVVGDELAIATHGRSFFVLEGLPVLRHLARAGRPTEATLYPVNHAVLSAIPASLNLFLPAALQDVRLRILDEDGHVVRHLPVGNELPAGGHTLAWPLRYDGAAVFPGMILEAPSPQRGPGVLPGAYTVRLTHRDGVLEQRISVSPDPRKGHLDFAALKAQRDLALKLRDAITSANGTVIAIRELAEDVRRSENHAPAEATALLGALHGVESTLYQTRNQSPKDKIAFPIQLNDRLSLLYDFVSRGDGRPTVAQHEVFAELEAELEAALARYRAVLDMELARFNSALTQAGMPELSAGAP